MNITTIGLDLAKNLFQVHGVNEKGKVVLRKKLKRADGSHPTVLKTTPQAVPW